MKINKYPDGTSYVEVNQENQETIFKINTYEDLHHLEQFVEAYNYNYKERPVIVIPNLIDAQADRRFGKNQSSGLKIVCKRLNSIDARFKIFHPHNPEVVEALIDNVKIIDNTKFINLVLNNLKYSFDERLVLMSSDAGGFKPLMKLCDKIGWQGETYSASKARSYVDGKSRLTQIIDRVDFGGKDILIIDDISVYGGTFKGLSKLFKERNCGKLYLAVSHMTVQDLGHDPVTNYFDKVFTTNSKFDKYVTKTGFKINAGVIDDVFEQPENLEIIKLF